MLVMLPSSRPDVYCVLAPQTAEVVACHPEVARAGVVEMEHGAEWMKKNQFCESPASYPDPTPLPVKGQAHKQYPDRVDAE